jgi:hypothetical protein
MFATAEDVKTYITAGKACFTLKSEKTGNHYTYAVNAAPANRGATYAYFVSALTGPNNETDFSYIGTIFRNGETFEFRTTQKSKLPNSALSVVSFRWFADRVFAGNMPQQVSMHHDGSCGRCGRKLTTPDSIERGIGPDCAEKMGMVVSEREPAKRRARKPAEARIPQAEHKIEAMPTWLR